MGTTEKYTCRFSEFYKIVNDFDSPSTSKDLMMSDLEKKGCDYCSGNYYDCKDFKEIKWE